MADGSGHNLSGSSAALPRQWETPRLTRFSLSRTTRSGDADGYYCDGPGTYYSYNDYSNYFGPPSRPAC